MNRIALLTGAVCLAVAAPAAAEPVNGRIAFSTFESGPAQGSGDIWTMNPVSNGAVTIGFRPRPPTRSGPGPTRRR
jgi:hypothetical protein